MSTHHSKSNDHHEGHGDHHDHGGHHGDHHGHFVVPKFTLRLIFGLLISLTILTVAAAQFEVAIASFFGFQIPGIVNVLIALSIATVKTTLVVMFFMQLRYDNPLNTMVFIFTIFTVAFFLGFTMIDLGNRGSVDRFKVGNIWEGGNPSMAPNINSSLVGLQNKLDRLAAFSPDDAKAAEAEIFALQTASLVRRVQVVDRFLAKHEGRSKKGYGSHGDDHSSSNAARPVVGLTLPSFVAGDAVPSSSNTGRD